MDIVLVLALLSQLVADDLSRAGQAATPPSPAPHWGAPADASDSTGDAASDDNPPFVAILDR